MLFLFIYTAQAHAQATPTSGTTCDGTYTGMFDGNVTVSASQICDFTSGGIIGNVMLSGGTFLVSNATVHGNVQVSGGGSLILTDATVFGDVQINGGGTFSIGPSTVINGNLEIQNVPTGPAQNQVCGTRVTKNLQVQNSRSPVEIGAPPTCAGNTIVGNLQVQNNAAPTLVADNTIGGNLQVQNNTPATLVNRNTVRGNVQIPSGITAITISSLSTTSASPFALLIINGSGFNPSAQPEVTFSNGDGFSVTLPTVLRTSTAVAASVPPFFDPRGNLGEGTVNISVSQVSSSGSTITSNVLNGFQIQAPPATSPLPAGSLTLALLNGTLQNMINLKSTIAGSSLDTPDMQSALSSEITALQNSIAQVQSVVSGASASFTVGQINGSNVSVGSQDLANADRLLLGLLTVLAGPVPDLSAFGVSSTIASASNPTQNAAQAALTAAANSVTTTLQLNNVFADLGVTFYLCNRQDVNIAISILTTALGAVATALGAAAALPEIAAVIAAALVSVDAWVSISILFEIGAEPVLWNTLKSAIQYCADGLQASDAIFAFLQGLLPEQHPAGSIADSLQIFSNITTILWQGGCTPRPPSLVVFPTALTFSGTEGGPNPPPQTLNVCSLGYPVPWAAATNGEWLGLTPPMGTTPGTATASATVDGLQPNTYQGSIIFGSALSPPTVVPVPVTFQVNPNCNISVTPSSLVFLWPQSPNAGVGYGASLSVNNPCASIPWSATSSVPWLTLTPTSGTGNGSVGATFSSVPGLTGGVYNGNIVVTSSGTSNNQQTIPVTLYIVGPIYSGIWSVTSYSPCSAPVGGTLTTITSGRIGMSGQWGYTGIDGPSFSITVGVGGSGTINQFANDPDSYTSLSGCTDPPPGMTPGSGAQLAEFNWSGTVLSGGVLSFQSFFGTPGGNCNFSGSGTLGGFSASGNCGLPSSMNPSIFSVVAIPTPVVPP